jgi:hypothetical protein
VPFETPVERQEHFDKHGGEFDGALTEEEYERRADAMIAGPLSYFLIECRHVYGGRARLNLITQEYCVTNRHGFLNTYFVANPMTHGKASNLAYHREWCI